MGILTSLQHEGSFFDQLMQDERYLLESQIKMLFKPYSRGFDHIPALGNPIAHALKAVIVHPSMIVGGILLLPVMLVSDPATAIPKLITGIMDNITCSALTAIHAVVSVLSIFTRTLATLCNGGYTHGFFAEKQNAYDAFPNEERNAFEDIRTVAAHSANSSGF